MQRILKQQTTLPNASAAKPFRQPDMQLQSSTYVPQLLNNPLTISESLDVKKSQDSIDMIKSVQSQNAKNTAAKTAAASETNEVKPGDNFGKALTLQNAMRKDPNRKSKRLHLRVSKTLNSYKYRCSAQHSLIKDRSSHSMSKA